MVGEPDAALDVDDDIAGAVESLPLVAVGADLDPSGLEVGAHHPPPSGWAEPGAFAADQIEWATQSIFLKGLPITHLCKMHEKCSTATIRMNRMGWHGLSRIPWLL
jgi:hypothetical protein